MVNPRWRILIVVVKEPVRSGSVCTSESLGLAPRDVAEMAAALLHLGAEVRVADQNAEDLSARVVRREVQLWRADLVLLYAGGSMVAADPNPDLRPMATILDGWRRGPPAVACGPLGALYGQELLQRLPRLVGALAGPVGVSLLEGFDPGSVPGMWYRQDGEVRQVEGSEPPSDADLLPAWHVLSLASYDAHTGWQRRIQIMADEDIELTLRRVGHAVRRAGAEVLVFGNRDLLSDRDGIGRLCAGMSAAAPTVPWTCRVRADHVTPMTALTLAQGGCQQVMIISPADPAAPAQPPMDDPARARIESAVEAARTTGMSLLVEHVVGRPGHSLEILAAWRRWFGDRRMAVAPRVMLLHAGAKGEGRPTLEEARRSAGCWDNELRPKDVERVVRSITAHSRAITAS